MVEDHLDFIRAREKILISGSLVIQQRRFFCILGETGERCLEAIYGHI